MTSNHRSPLWPYLLVLAGLFVLSVAVPRGWQNAPQPKQVEERWSHITNLKAAARSPGQIAVVRPAPPPVGASPMATLSPESKLLAPSVAVKLPPVKTAATGGFSIDYPMIEAVAKKIADLRFFSVASALPANDAPAALHESVLQREPTVKIAPAPEHNLAPKNDAAGDSDVAPKNTPTAAKTDDPSYGWPTPQSLLIQLDRLARYVEYRAWANQVENLCIQLRRVAASDPRQAKEIVNQLATLYTQSGPLADTGPDEIAMAELRQARYGLQRRLLLWMPALAVPLRAGDANDAAAVSIDIDQVLAGLERYETLEHAGDAHRAVEFAERLNDAPDKNGQQLAQNLEHVYRNTNMRLVISDAYLERLAEQQVDDRLHQQMVDLLKNLELELKTIGVDNSGGRLTARLRLAGGNQLGGYTARPQAPGNSVVSVQLHESAINNALDQLELAGRSFTLPELYCFVAQRLNLSDTTPPDDFPTGVSLKFANQDSVRVRCSDGVVRVTLVIDELRQGEQRWHDFSIAAAYVPAIDGLHVRLARQGNIEFTRVIHKDQPLPALRDLANQILARQRTLELIPLEIADGVHLADLRVAQCVIEDGWIGVALSPNRPGEQVAQRSAAN